MTTRESMDSAFRSTGVFYRTCASCSPTTIYYKRITPIPSDFSFYDSVIITWSSRNNLLNVDFRLYPSYNDYMSDTNRWTYCNYDDPGVGFPRGCNGPGGGYGWSSNPNSPHTGVTAQYYITGGVSIDYSLLDKCQPGQYYSTAQTSCVPCEIGSYAPHVNVQSKCTPCPSGQTTIMTGATSLKSCISIPSSQPNSQPSQPTSQPTSSPSRQPSSRPSSSPTNPTGQPSSQPTNPTGQPSRQPSRQPSSQPSSRPSSQPTSKPSFNPSSQPSSQPSRQPSSQPSSQPSCDPSSQPSLSPTSQPSVQPSGTPSSEPSTRPTTSPSVRPSHQKIRVTISADGSDNCLDPDGQYRSCIHLSEVTAFAKYRSDRIIPITWTKSGTTQIYGTATLLSKLTDKNTSSNYHSGFSVGNNAVQLVGVMATDDLYSIEVTPAKGYERERRGLSVKVEVMNHKVSNEFSGGPKCVDYTAGVGQYGYGYGRMCAFYDYQNDLLYYAPHYGTNECSRDSDCPASLATTYPYIVGYTYNCPSSYNCYSTPRYESGPFYQLTNSESASRWCESLDLSSDGWNFYFNRYLCSQAVSLSRYSNEWTSFPVIPGTDRVDVQYDGSLTHNVPIFQYQYDNVNENTEVPYVNKVRQVLPHEY